MEMQVKTVMKYYCLLFTMPNNKKDLQTMCWARIRKSGNVYKIGKSFLKKQFGNVLKVNIYLLNDLVILALDIF